MLKSYTKSFINLKLNIKKWSQHADLMDILVSWIGAQLTYGLLIVKSLLNGNICWDVSA